MTKYNLFLFAAVIAISSTSIAQQSAMTGGGQSEFPQYSPNLLPSSPDAYSFTKYGNLPIGLSTGTIQYSIPVYTIQSGSLNHTISINYSSNGVKVDEMATRTGINWSLKAGGMITRVVMDMPDEAPGVSPTFFHGPIIHDTGSSASWNFYDYVKQASYATRPDYQPDEYSFNMDGYSGKFLKRENGAFAQFNSSGVKIEKNSSGFILTTPNGTKYYFYLDEVVRNYPPANPSVLEWIPEQVPTSWYLTKIVSTTRDSIVFNYLALKTDPDSSIIYTNGITQNYNTGTADNLAVNPGEYNMGFLGSYAPPLPYVAYACQGNPGLVTSVQQTENKPNYLSSIAFNNGSVEFKYSGRMDVVGEKKLDTVKIKRSGDNKIIKCVALQYTYSNAVAGSYDTYIVPGTNYTNSDSSLRKRLFLTAADEVSSDLLSSQRQTFEYEDINGLPPRLSFSQDRYGSFNGKVNTTYFFPNDTWFDKFIGNRRFGGDRTYSFTKAKKGILKKINYPTGGSTQFEFEPNKTETDYAYVYNRDSVYAIGDTSSYTGQEFTSDTLYFDGQRDLILKGFCEWASNPVLACEGIGCTDLDDQYYFTAQIINYNTSTTCTTDFCTTVIYPGQSFYHGGFAIGLPAGTYFIKMTASRPRLRGKVTLERSQRIADRSDSSGIAGIRVKAISDYIDDTHQANRREFIYGDWGNAASSSGTGLNTSLNNGSEISLTRTVGHPMFAHSNREICGYNTIHSNSVLTSFLSENNTVLYRKVIELHAADSVKNNGGTEYEFYYDQKKYPIPVSFTWGQFVWDPVPVVPPGASYMNNDYRTGSLKNTKVFTYQQKHSTRTVLQESANYYSLDTSNLLIDTFTVSKHVVKRDSYGAGWAYFIDYDIYRYWRYFGFLKQDSTVQKNYTASGELTTKLVYLAYDNHNYKPNDVRVYGSAGEIKAISRKYTCDVAYADPDYSIYNPMKQANMIDHLLEEKSYITDGVSTTIELSKKKMNHGHTLGLYLPSSAYSSQKSGTEYQEIAYQEYDSSGNLLQYTGRDGVINSIIWGYGKIYPVAKVVGKTYSDAISQSSINMGVVNNPSSESAIKTELDKLRTLSSSFVTTYIYNPLIGLTSQADPNGIITYYEYDNFNRLSLIRDKDRNVIKKICYNFQGQPVDCGFGSLAAWQAISSVCQDSSGTYTGNLIVTEKDMNPSSATYNQTRTTTITGARTACPINCTGLDKKIINGVCETGTKICTGDFRPPGQLWQHYYHYQWSDSSISDTYIGQGFGCMEL